MGLANYQDTCCTCSATLAAMSAATSLDESNASSRFHVLPEWMIFRISLLRAHKTHQVERSALKTTKTTKKQLLSLESLGFL